jgi:hypothetical protein
MDGYSCPIGRTCQWPAVSRLRQCAAPVNDGYHIHMYHKCMYHMYMHHIHMYHMHVVLVCPAPAPVLINPLELFSANSSKVCMTSTRVQALVRSIFSKSNAHACCYMLYLQVFQVHYNGLRPHVDTPPNNSSGF